MRRGPLLVALAAAVVVTAVAVAAVKHDHRSQFAELQRLVTESDRLDDEWRQLQLEQGAWAGHARVERLAREELEMKSPQRDEIVILGR